MPSHPHAGLRRRTLVQGLLAAAGASVLPGQGRALTLAPEDAQLGAEFDPQAGIWLGWDAGHEPLTLALAHALAGHVPIRMLVRDGATEARARAMLRQSGLAMDGVSFVQDSHALFFTRDAAVFGIGAGGQRFVMDFRWTHYGWPEWCRRTHGEKRALPDACRRPVDPLADAFDRRFADALGLPSFQTSLAMEGGGIETNGRGLLIANEAVWRSRNPGLGRDAMQKALLRLPGTRKVIWLPYGLAHDPLHRATITGNHVGWGTGGHTDEFVRFADARTVLLAWPDPKDVRKDPVARLNEKRMQANHAVLSASTDTQGQPLRVLKVPLPRTVQRSVRLSADADTAYSEQWTARSFPSRERRREGQTVQQVATTSYLNHVVANGLVLLPDYLPHGTPPQRQAQVHDIYQAAFPGREIRFLDAISLNWVGGGLHCATLSEPAGAA
jgi:agmatine deiminase